MSYYFVFLRRPKNIDDKRDDPFWEFGSFGKTGCHSRNLLNPRRTHLQDGDRLVFIQGGIAEIKIVGVTPTIRVKRTLARLELLWDASYRPMPYSKAPLLIKNDGTTDFPAVHNLILGTRRSTYSGAAASRLRSSTKPVDDELATQIIRRFAETDLSKVDIYIDAIEAPNRKWHCNAKNLNWGSIASRSDAYYASDMGDGKDSCEIGQ